MHPKAKKWLQENQRGTKKCKTAVKEKLAEETDGFSCQRGFNLIIERARSKVTDWVERFDDT
jgi:hypothetical protein